MVGFFVLVIVYYQFFSWAQVSGQMWRTFVFHSTDWPEVSILLGCTGLAAGLAWLGRRLVRGPIAPTPHSVGATAARFSKGGQVGAGLDSLIVLYLLGYRFFI
jgi:hypothetical protein